MANNYTKINSIVTNETKAAVAALQSSQRKLGMKHGDDSLEHVTTTINKSFGMANRIRFRFKKSGVFVHKGVGRGGSANRTPKEWFNPVVEKFADDLANKMADEFVDISFSKLKIN